MTVLRRTLAGLLVIWVVLSISFVLMDLAPGAPWSADRSPDPAVRAQLEALYRLDYFTFLSSAVQGDFGYSWRYPDRTVGSLLAEGWPASLQIGGLALVFALVVALPLGTLAAFRPGGLSDSILAILTALAVTVPAFVLAPLVQEVAGNQVGWIAGWEGPWSRILPAAVLAAPVAAWTARLLRAGMRDALLEAHVRTARAKGLSPLSVVVRHALPGAMGPVLQYLGPASAALLTGGLVVEQVFALPGLGRHFVQGALQRDAPLVLGVVTVYGLLLVAMNAFADLGLHLLDPRLRTVRERT